VRGMRKRGKGTNGTGGRRAREVRRDENRGVPEWAVNAAVLARIFMALDEATSNLFEAVYYPNPVPD